MTTDRKKKRRRTFRLALLGIILVLLLLLLLGDRWGIGPGDILLLTSPAPAQETPDRSGDQTGTYQEVVITVSDTTLRVGETSHTLDSLEYFLDEGEGNILYVLEDRQANYGLFTAVEAMLQERELMYVIED
jgi:hypothetical protein